MARMRKLVLSSLWFWRVALAVALAACLGLAIYLWHSGAGETRDAFMEGRRLLVHVGTGAVEGKLLTAEPPKETPPAEPAPAEPVVETSPEPAPVPEPEAAPPDEALPAEEPAIPDAVPNVAPVEPVADEPAADIAAPEPASPLPEADPGAPPEPAVQETPPAAELPVEPADPQEIPQEVPPPSLPSDSSGDMVPAASEAPVAAASEPPPPAEPMLPAALTPLTPSETPPAAFNNALAEKVDAGLVPMIAADGAKPWRYYAKAFSRQGSQPMIAIVVTGLGHNKTVTDFALRLPADMTLSFSPYAKNVGSWASAARLAGHEFLVDLPMQSAAYPASDPGPYGLLLDRGLEENARRLEWLMSRFPGYVGLLTPNDEVYSANAEAFRVLLQSLANRGLMLVMGREPFKSDVKLMLESSNTASVTADALIDEELSPAAIQTRLSQLEQLAVKRGYAVGVAQPFPLTLQQLSQWEKTLARKGIVLVPVTAVARLRFS